MMMMDMCLIEHATKIGEIAYPQNFISGFGAQGTVLIFHNLN